MGIGGWGLGIGALLAGLLCALAGPARAQAPAAGHSAMTEPAGWPLGSPDLVVTLPAYTMPAGEADVFRTFVMPIPVAAVKYVRAVHFRPAVADGVHHANIRIDRTPASRTLDRADDEPGYAGVMATSARFPDGHFLAWTPGQRPSLAPPGFAWRLDPGTDLVVQLHLQPGGVSQRVQGVVGFYFGDAAPGQTPTILKLSRQDIDIPAGAAGYPLEDSFALPVDVEVHAVQPHAHTRARRVLGAARLPDGTTQTLIALPQWDFRAQHFYRLDTPLRLPKGTVLSMRITYDNPSASRLQYGWQTNDEMGELYVQVLARTDRDRDLLERTHERKAIADDIAGYDTLIRRKAPNAAALRDELPFLHLQLGNAYEGLGQLVAAEQAYRAAVRLAPALATARERLGQVLLRRGATDEARDYLEK